MNIFGDSSFCKKRPTFDLPMPAAIRAINIASGHIRATHFNRPSPVKIPSLGLIVKYGADVTIAEAQTQMNVRKRLQGRVPVPEVFAWAEDEGQGFIYISLVEGETLQERWGNMSELERQAICEDLRLMAKAWRALEQEGQRPYIGGPDKQPLNDIFLASCPGLVGPFHGFDAVQRFQAACGIAISTETAIVFTHSDLVPPNILLSPGPNPKVEAVIDWAQAGWYPAYWEYCKARRVRLDPECFSDALQEEWRDRYLPRIVDPVDDEMCYHPWLYFVLTKGI
ncbi:phosphotransferase enzyme family protein [Sodiomyces alkalinus F11]|uniref:Phosphotransferase enzyme family protein n=1 Tax=Sodiomyces alkalinus (strain CBS 110278 / VKM F-3762 / F11) TaxID=1314773 RepID=A0A3N2PRK2_SODAK|nr:phosphotransferase enzyme family protein [Sodiomyces alkalinus F11]ROT37125.1 phosphotransferase enzyme family protein [Sodiomyces alkalinus F11]